MYTDPLGHDATLINYRGSFYTLREMNAITSYSKNGNNETNQVKKEVYPGHYEWVSVPTSYTYEDNMERYYGNLYRVLDEMEFNLNDYTPRQVDEAHQRMKDSGLTFSGNWFEKWLFEDTGFGLEIKSQQTKAQQSMSLHYVIAEHFKSEWDAYMSNSTATLQGAGIFISSGYGTPKTPSASDAATSKLDYIDKNGVNSGPTNYTKPTIVQNLERAGNGGVGNLKGSLNGLKTHERAAVDDLLAQGKNVEIIPKDIAPNGMHKKTPDFYVNGVKTELKTLKPTGGEPNLNTGITRIQEGFKQKSEVVVLDGRNVNLTKEQAQSIINRTVGSYKNSGGVPGKIEIWTNDGIITYP